MRNQSVKIRKKCPSPHIKYFVMALLFLTVVILISQPKRGGFHDHQCLFQLFLFCLLIEKEQIECSIFVLNLTLCKEWSYLRFLHHRYFIESLSQTNQIKHCPWCMSSIFHSAPAWKAWRRMLETKKVSFLHFFSYFLINWFRTYVQYCPSTRRQGPEAKLLPFTS